MGFGWSFMLLDLRGHEYGAALGAAIVDQALEWLHVGLAMGAIQLGPGWCHGWIMTARRADSRLMRSGLPIIYLPLTPRAS